MLRRNGHFHLSLQDCIIKLISFAFKPFCISFSLHKRLFSGHNLYQFEGLNLFWKIKKPVTGPTDQQFASSGPGLRPVPLRRGHRAALLREEHPGPEHLLRAVPRLHLDVSSDRRRLPVALRRAHVRLRPSSVPEPHGRTLRPTAERSRCAVDRVRVRGHRDRVPAVPLGGHRETFASQK